MSGAPGPGGGGREVRRARLPRTALTGVPSGAVASVFRVGRACDKRAHLRLLGAVQPPRESPDFRPREPAPRAVAPQRRPGATIEPAGAEFLGVLAWTPHPASPPSAAAESRGVRRSGGNSPPTGSPHSASTRMCVAGPELVAIAQILVVDTPFRLGNMSHVAYHSLAADAERREGVDVAMTKRGPRRLRQHDCGPDRRRPGSCWCERRLSVAVEP